MCGGGSAPGSATSSTNAYASPVSVPLILRVTYSVFPAQYAVPSPGGTCVVPDVTIRGSLLHRSSFFPRGGKPLGLGMLGTLLRAGYSEEVSARDDALEHQGGERHDVQPRHRLGHPPQVPDTLLEPI